MMAIGWYRIALWFYEISQARVFLFTDMVILVLMSKRKKNSRKRAEKERERSGYIHTHAESQKITTMI